MKSFIFITLVFFLATLAVAQNPGLIAGVDLTLMNKIKAKYFDFFMERLNNIHIDDIDKGSLLIATINLEVENNNHENTQLSLNQEKNALGVTVMNTHIRISVNWRYKLGFVKIKGQGEVKGTVSQIGINLGFETQEKEGRMIPAFNLQDVDVQLDNKSFDFRIKCAICPGFVTNFILNCFRGNLLYKVTTQTSKVINRKLVETINKAIYKKYILDAKLKDQFSISLANTGPIFIKSDHLSAPIDSTISVTNEAQSHPVDGLVTRVESVENPGDIILFVRKNMYKVLEESINKNPIIIKSKVVGLDSTLEFIKCPNPLKVVTIDGKVRMVGVATVSIPKLYTTIDFVVYASLDLYFRSGDATSMIYIVPKVNKDSLELSDFKYFIFGSPSELGTLINVNDMITTAFTKKLEFSTIALLKRENPPLVNVASLVNFFGAHNDVGISFEHSEDH